MHILNLGCGQHHHPDWINVDFSSTGPGVIAYDLQWGIPFSSNSFDVVYHSHLLEHFPRRRAFCLMQECFRVLKPGGIIRVVVPDLEQITRTYLEILEKAEQGDPRALTRYDWIIIEMLDQMVRNRQGGEMLEYWKQNPIPAEDFVLERVGSEALNYLATIRTSGFQEPDNPQNTTRETDPAKIGLFRTSGEVHQWMYDRHSLPVLLNNTGFKDVHLCKANESVIPDFNVYLLDIEEDGSVRKPDSLFMEAAKPLKLEGVSEESSAAESQLQLVYIRQQLEMLIADRAPLDAKLKECEVDRAARLEVIQSQIETVRSLEETIRSLQAFKSDMEGSLSWRLTSPIRRLYAMLKGDDGANSVHKH